ncbi:MAG: CAP domain-containing protein, partial [Hyphomicrobium sp.]|nr:CAP domain-containing protein [Hyphomicrobium sp.]
LDHNGFKERARYSSGAAAENVLWGCEDQDCAIRMWAKSAGHRRNMLMKGVSAYGIASATSENGRKYWVMELGN